jgi:hypothetical protein
MDEIRTDRHDIGPQPLLPRLCAKPDGNRIRRLEKSGLRKIKGIETSETSIHLQTFR